MHAQDAEIVRTVPLFSAMMPSSVDALCDQARLQRHPAGVTLLLEGERPDHLLVLIEGLVEIFARHGGRETTLTVLTRPSALMLATVIVDDVNLTSARTLAPSTVVLMPAAVVRDILLRDPGLARATTLELSRCYRAAIKDLKSQRLRTGVQRLANWIIAQDKLTGGTGRVHITYEKRVLASQLGLRPENLSRAFAELQRKGLAVNGPVITIEDRERLQSVADPDPLIDGPERSDAPRNPHLGERRPPLPSDRVS
jgi:CRP/FNR family transcriptional activator FtrB